MNLQAFFNNNKVVLQSTFHWKCNNTFQPLQSLLEFLNSRLGKRSFSND